MSFSRKEDGICYYKCDRCGTELDECLGRIKLDNNDLHLCWDCAFIEDYIEQDEYVKVSGNTSINVYAEVQNGKILIWLGCKPVINKDERKSNQYKKWRKQVLERDMFTCKKCNLKGGNLHVHHIKGYADYPELRYKIENGITLCESCHRKEHQKKVAE